MRRGLALAAASTFVVGCGFSEIGGLGGSAPLGDGSVIDSGVDVTRVDSGTTPDVTAEETIDLDADAESDADDAIDDADADGGCPPITEVDPCKAVPSLVVAAQTVDGDPSDFVCLPVTTFTLASAVATDPKPPPAGLGEQVKMRYAWTPDGLAVHVHVVDPTIVVAPTTDPNLYDGDAVELFVSGSGTLTGTFDGTNDPDSNQIIVTPAFSGVPARAKLYQSGDRGPIDPSDYATKLTVDGYSVELALPWSFLGGEGAVGSKIGLDLALDVCDDAAHPAARQVWAVWQQKSVAGKTSCPTGTTSWAYCDDRSWCTPSLE